MCMNCGCGQPNDEQGNSANITYNELQQAAQANGMSVDQAVHNMVDSLHKVEGHDPMTQSSSSSGTSGGASSGSSYSQS